MTISNTTLALIAWVSCIVAVAVLAACAPADVTRVNTQVNATPVSLHRSKSDDYPGVQAVLQNGGNCYQKAWAKCGMLYPDHQCRVVLGRLDDGTGHAVALVDDRYWLDNRSAGVFKPGDFEVMQ